MRRIKVEEKEVTADEATKLCRKIADETPRHSAWIQVSPAADPAYMDEGEVDRGPTISIDTRELTPDQLRRMADILDQVKP
jgi:hypothetical protein